MKTKEQIEAGLHRIGDFTIGDVFTTEEFAELVKSNCINGYDGFGYYHDGEHKTSIGCFRLNPSSDNVQKKYPYVIWYNK